jgi:hypothetical protein
LKAREKIPRAFSDCANIYQISISLKMTARSGKSLFAYFFFRKSKAEKVTVIVTRRFEYTNASRE